MTTLVYACHWTCCLWMMRVRITMRCLHVSSDFPSLDDEGADNLEVSPRVIGLAISDDKGETKVVSVERP